MKSSFLHQLQKSVMGLHCLFVMKMVVDNFSACCCSHYVVASFAMSFKVMAEHCCVKKFKTEKMHAYKTLKSIIAYYTWIQHIQHKKL